MLIEFNNLRVLSISLDEPASIFVANYSNNSQKIVTNVTILCQTSAINTKEFFIFKKKPLNLKFKTSTFFVEIVKLC